MGPPLGGGGVTEGYVFGQELDRDNKDIYNKDTYIYK
jgi:hypothetical protein